MSFSAVEVLRRLEMSPVSDRKVLSGGGAQQVVWCRLSDGADVVVKSRAGAAAGYFAAESEGLKALAAASRGLRLRVVRVLHHQHDCIVLQGVETGVPAGDFWRVFGRDLARLHQREGASEYGWDADNFIGSREQSNGWLRDWGSFFWQRRLWPRLRQLWPELNARERGQAETLERRVTELLPVHPHPSLLHGDLWAGNFLVDSGGAAVLIDPAVYHGHSEADLAMTRLFGGFGADFYRGYAEVLPPEAGVEARYEIYNLYHLCNHWLSFGGSYRAAVLRVLRRYGG